MLHINDLAHFESLSSSSSSILQTHEIQKPENFSQVSMFPCNNMKENHLQKSLNPFDTKQLINWPDVEEEGFRGGVVKGGEVVEREGDGCRYIITENELVEVLWKQDIDLGYSLNVPQTTTTTTTAATTAITINNVKNNNDNNKSSHNAYANAKDDDDDDVMGNDTANNIHSLNADDLEKLKALEELKQNNHNDLMLTNEIIELNDTHETHVLDDDIWSSGIPFTIDNETGEYIRLPLDEILNDVIQFAELANETNQITDENNINSYPTDDSSCSNRSNKINTSTTKLNKCVAATIPLAQKSVHHNGNIKKDISESEGDKLNNNDTSTVLDVPIHNIKSEDNNQNHKQNNNNKINQFEKSDANFAIHKVEEIIEEEGSNDNNLIEFDDVDYLSSPLFDLDDEAKEELAGLDMMLHTATPFVATHPHTHPHPHPHPHPHGHPQTHPSHTHMPHHHPHHVHPHHHHPTSHHPHHTHYGRAGSSTAGLTQHYGGGVNSAFHRQPTTSAGLHHANHQGRMPISRGVSMEQRLQDIASLFNPIPSMGVGVGVGVSVMGGVSEMPPYHYPTHHYSYQTPAAVATSNSSSSGSDSGQHGQYSAGMAAASSSLQPPPPPPPTHAHPHAHAHLQHTHAAAMHHANATTSLNDLCATQPHYGHNLGSAVSSSMHLTNSTHDNDNLAGTLSTGHMATYKMEHHDIMYYSNASSTDINHTTTDGFINSILNDEDLHLMDMNVNENFYRMVDVNNASSNNSTVLGLTNHLSNANGLTMSGDNHANLATIGIAIDRDGRVGGGGDNGGGGELMVVSGSGTTDRLDASSDSAVSSMGSERVSSLSDGEWGEGSDSAQDYHPGKYDGGGGGGTTNGSGRGTSAITVPVGPCDYSYNNGGTINTSNNNNNNRQPIVAQKKHHMFGKRFLNDQSSNTHTMANASTIMERLPHQIAGPSIKYEYETYGPMNGTNLSQNHHSNDMDIHAMHAPIIGKEYSLHGNGAYSLDFSMRTPRTTHEIIQHNHTYTLPQEMNCLTRPQLRDKKHSLTSNKLMVSAASSSTSSSSITSSAATATASLVATTASVASAARRKSHLTDSNSINDDGDDDIYMTRDEKRARAMNIPIPVTDIINLPMDEFNERLSKYDLNESQLSLIRDIRRRGKNKVAAQNCRKRKLDQIISLEDEVKQVRQRKEQLQQQREHLCAERKRITTKFNTLQHHIFQYLRDASGNPCSPREYSLEQSSDGAIYLLPCDGIGNKNDSLNNNSDVGIDNANNLLPLNININAANHSSSSSSSNSSSSSSSNGNTNSNSNSAMIVASSQVASQHQRSRSQVARSQQGQSPPYIIFPYEYLQHPQQQQQHHHQQQHPQQQQQQHASISSIESTLDDDVVAAVTADNIMTQHNNGHQMLPHQSQKD